MERKKISIVAICNQFKKIEKNALFLMVMAVLAMVIIKDATICITWDESLTYSAYVRPIADANGKISAIWEVIKSSIGNNHLLNTFFIMISEFIFGVLYNEMVVRFPSLVACILYMIIILYLYNKKKIGFVGSCLFLLNYYVVDFFSLARGYSLAVVGVFAALILLKNWCESGNQKMIIWCCVCLAVATLANTVVLLITLSMGCYALAILMKRHELIRFIKKYIVFLLLFAIFNVIMVFYHFLITNNDPYLFYTSELFPIKVIKDFFEMYIPVPSLVVAICAWVYLVLFVLSNYLCFKKREGFFCPIILIYFCVSIILAIASHKGVPSDRALLPAFTLFVFSLLEMYSFCIKPYILCFCNVKKFILRYAIVIILLFCFISRISFSSSVDWKISKDYKKIAYTVYGEQNKLTPEILGTSNYDGIKFYREQIMHLYGYDIFY